MLACECATACLGVQFGVAHQRCQVWLAPPGANGTRSLSEPDVNASDNLVGHNDTQCLAGSATASGGPRRRCHPDDRLPPGTPVLLRRGEPSEWRLGAVKVSYSDSFMVELSPTSGGAAAGIAQAEAAGVLDLGQFSRLQAGDHVLAKVSKRLLPVQVAQVYPNHTLDVRSQDGELMHAMSASSEGEPAGVAEVYASSPRVAAPALPAEGAERNSVEFDVDVQNVSFESLAADPALLQKLQMAMKQEISSQADCGVPPIAVKIVSGRGQGRYGVSLAPPLDLQVRKLESHLKEGPGKSLMERGLAMRIANVSGIGDALQGAVGVSLSGVALTAEPSNIVTLGSAGPLPDGEPGGARPWLSGLGLKGYVFVGEVTLAAALLVVACFLACHLPRQVDARAMVADEGPEESRRCAPCCGCLCCLALVALANLALAQVVANGGEIPASVDVFGKDIALPALPPIGDALGPVEIAALVLVAELVAVCAIHREGARRAARAQAELAGQAALHDEAQKKVEAANETARRAEAAHRAAKQELQDQARARQQAEADRGQKEESARERFAGEIRALQQKLAESEGGERHAGELRALQQKLAESEEERDRSRLEHERLQRELEGKSPKDSDAKCSGCIPVGRKKGPQDGSA